MSFLEKTLAQISPLDPLLLEQARAKLDNKTKPLGSLGRLEEFARRFAAISGTLQPDTAKKIIFTFAADHGVVEEGISRLSEKGIFPDGLQFSPGRSGHQRAGAPWMKMTCGWLTWGWITISAPCRGSSIARSPKASPTFTKGPAMSRQQAVAALEAGIALAHGCRDEGVTMVGTGEMGIGNTTAAFQRSSPSSPGCRSRQVTSRGTGINDTVLANKIRVIEQALQINRPDPTDPLDILTKVGGLEIAGIAGLMIGCAFKRIPVVVDGIRPQEPLSPPG